MKYLLIIFLLLYNTLVIYKFIIITSTTILFNNLPYKSRTVNVFVDSIHAFFKFSLCYGDIPYDVTAWTLPDTINSDILDIRKKPVWSNTANRYPFVLFISDPSNHKSLLVLSRQSIFSLCILHFIINLYSDIYRVIDQMSIVFDNGSGDRGSILGRVIPKTQKMVLDTALLNT